MEQRQITDPAALKAFAHPLRVKLFDVIATRGSATAAVLATETGEPAQLVSYHLRELAKHGFLELAPELARDSRERVWRLVPGNWGWSSAAFTDAAGKTASRAAQGALVALQLEKLAAWHASGDAFGTAWVEAASSFNGRLKLTVAEMQELTDDLGALMTKWSEKTKPLPVPGDDGREHVFLFAHAFPVPS